MKTDIQIAQEAVLDPILDVARRMGVPQEAVIPYGRTKAKVIAGMLPEKKTPAKVILVTAISPTPAGEGKTTTSVGLADALHRMGKNVCLALREPSLGPVFGIKGGAAGGGYAQVVPMEDINLHFTGDLHAIGAANNLLAAMPVSYTHLDVYKRQEIASLLLLLGCVQLPCMILGGRPADRFPKRNIIIVCDLVTVASYMVCAFLPVSYTHLKYPSTTRISKM